ncbi:MAG TPA: cysteine--tRNA ligase [Candidatus Saccharimonadales bacterium]|nr:cysteine--tRNA ligase [Candidatus Saccharimonadales bacterium]
MKLYNTLTKQVDELTPLEQGKIKLFVCGPTVYDLAQLGNGRTYTTFDVLARTLRLSQLDTFYLQNITDIDDKIIKRAEEKNIDWKELTAQYLEDYMADMQWLGNTSVSEYARATDYIDDIVKQVQGLIDKGYAYTIDDGVYFEITKFPDYGKLSGRHDVQEDDAQSRIDQSDQKRGWNDFCLWKFSKPGEPVWQAPFGAGRPGWHIEDTAITEHFFGPQYDMHGGAIDLIFPHHEAELTQMESLSGKVPFVTTWVHGGFLTVNNKRMGKSMGNFVTIRDVKNRGYDAAALRLLFLQAHYRSPLDFTWESLDAAANRLSGYNELADLRWQTVADEQAQGMDSFRQTKAELLRCMQDDLDTPSALAVLSAFSDQAKDSLVSQEDESSLVDLLEFVDDLFGLQLAKRPDISNHQKQLITDREQAREAKDWQMSDEIRDQLKKQGIGLNDTGHGAIWFRF